MAGKGQPGVYGTLKTFAAGNIPGGRISPTTWTDKNGNFWLFGGQGTDANGNPGFLNDLWEFKSATNQWAWMGGSSTVPTGAGSSAGQSGLYGSMGTAAAGNTPGGRGAGAGFIDSSGNLWLFGGYGYGAYGAFGGLDDVWEFNPSSGEWAWIAGSNGVNQLPVPGTTGAAAAGNTPGAHFGEIGWTDKSGNFWFFGGNTCISGTCGYGTVPPDVGLDNSLWEFNPATMEWTFWAGGTYISGYSGLPVGAIPIYGTLGAFGGYPGSRANGTGWTDSNGNLWMFGGWGFGAGGAPGYLDDLWEFNPSLGEWAWVGGGTTTPAPTSGAAGAYGTLGSPSLGNNPGARMNATSWIDSNGNAWLFGGYGFDSTGAGGQLNDLWELNTASYEWTWVSGSSTIGTSGWPGIYGTLNVPAAGNTPGSRLQQAGWADGLDHIWMFGGNGLDKTSTAGLLNDVWEFEPGQAPLQTPTVTVTPNPASITTAQGDTVTVTVSGNPTPTGSVTLSSGTYISAAATLVSGSAMITVPAGSLATGNDTLTATYTPDSTSSSTYNSATGTNSVTVTAAALTSQTITVATAAPASAADNSTFMVAATASSGLPVSITASGACSGSGSGSATITMTAATGTCTVTYTQAGNSTYAAAPTVTSSTTATAAPLTSQTITVTTAAPASAADNSTFMVAATASSGLTVSIAGSGSCSGSGTGSATITMTAATGTCTVTYTQAGNSTYAAAPTVTSMTSATAAALTSQTITVTTAAPASAADNSTFMVAATASSGLPVSITASGSCSGSATGSATITMTAATGTCTVTYTQAGNSTYAAAPTVTSSTTATNAAPAPTFTLGSPTGAQTVQPGASAQYTIIATAQNGTFSGSVALSASGLPSGATAMFSPASVVPGSTSANSTLTIQTPAQARVEPARDPRWPLAVPALALVGFFFLPGKRRRRWTSMALLLIASLGVSTALTACGGGFGLVTAAPATNYNITVTGTSGSVVQTTTVQLTIE
jgi:N-acetylneuraminic acid mutarotase